MQPWRPEGSKGRQPWLFLLLTLAACSSPEPDSRHQWLLFGTIVTLTTYGETPETAGAAAAAIFDRFTILDHNWYPWPTERGPASGELPNINQAIAKGQTTIVSEATAHLLKRAAELEALSNGLFNPAIGQLSKLWGFADPVGQWSGPPAADAIETLLAASPSTRQLQWRGNQLSSNSPDVVLDPGGIAKGAIVHEALLILGEFNIENAIIDIGGDLAVLGQRRGKSMRVGIKAPSPNPGENPVLGWSELRSGETAFTSGNYERYFEKEGKRYQHILDPRSGWPVTHTVSVTVIDQDPVLADAAATALVVGGPEQFATLTKSMGIQDALLISAEGERLMTPSMQRRLHWTTQ
jgi:thiamine biosynthesis lipoprotein